jgi:hypothetical protein
VVKNKLQINLRDPLNLQAYRYGGCTWRNKELLEKRKEKRKEKGRKGTRENHGENTKRRRKGILKRVLGNLKVRASSGTL